MRTRDFVALCERVLSENSKREDREALVNHAIALRILAIEHVDREDTWDEDWPELGYFPYSDDEDDEYRELKKWHASVK